jgi:hypothetical protein
LSTTNPTWVCPGRCGGKPAANPLSYGTALLIAHIDTLRKDNRGKLCHKMAWLPYLRAECQDSRAEVTMAVTGKWRRVAW